MKKNSSVFALIITCCLFFITVNAHEIGSGLTEHNNGGERAYHNILIAWEPSTSEIAVTVTVTMGTALIGSMKFTPDTLKQTLNYSNPPQLATGMFVIEFNAKGDGGKLFAENLNWITKSNTGNVTSLIGMWSISK